MIAHEMENEVIAAAPMPAKIRIIGKTYRVQTQPETPLCNSYYGFHDGAAGTLTVMEGLSPDQARDTLLHECLHGIDYAMSLGLEERQVHALAAGILALLNDNPALLEWLR